MVSVFRRLAPLAIVAALAGHSHGQLPPPTPTPVAAAGFDLGSSAYQLRDATQQLATEIEGSLRDTPRGRELVTQSRDLARVAREFNDTNFYQQLHNTPDTQALRQLYVGVGGIWRQLKVLLAQPGLSTPALDRLSQRVEIPHAQIVHGLGLAGPPQNQFTQPNQPIGDPRANALNGLAHQMAEQVNALAADLATDLADTPSGRHLIGDAQELGQAVAEFHDSLHGSGDPFQVRRAFAGVDGSWHHLAGQLARPGVASPAVARAAARVDQTDGQIHQALGLAAPPPDLYGVAEAPVGQPEVQRLAYGLYERSQNLARAVQAESTRMPRAPRLIQDASLLVRESGNFYQQVGQGPPPAGLAGAYGPVAQVCDRLERDLAGPNLPPNVQSAWQGFASAAVLLREQIGLPASPPTVPIALQPAGGPSPVIALSEQLLGQIDAFLEAFSATGGNVPEGAAILADAQRLRVAAVAFRQQSGRGIAPNQLAFAFQDVDASWNRLSRRINRIARGQTGPNIQMASRMGQTCQQIHQILGMPGYAPTLGF